MRTMVRPQGIIDPGTCTYPGREDCEQNEDRAPMCGGASQPKVDPQITQSPEEKPMTDLTTSDQTATAWTTKNKVGLGLAVLYAVANIPTVFIPVDAGDGPPFAISLICTILAVVATVAGVVAWRQGSRPAARLTAASLVVITLTALPAFFLDVPAGVKVVAAVGVVLTVVIVVLMFSGAQRSSSTGSP